MASNLTAQVRNIADVTTAVANGDLSKKITVDVKGEILELKDTINTMVDQLSLLRLRSDARGARSGHRRQARRPGRRAGRGRHLEGPDRLGELDGRQPDRQVRNIADVTTAVANGDLSQEDHGGRAGRDSGAEGHHQHDGGPAALVRVRSDPRGARGGHRRQAGRPGRRAGRRRHLEGPDRQRELHGVEPDGSGAQHRRRDDGRGERRPVEEDHGGREGRDSRTEGHHQHHGGPADARSPPK